MDIIKRYIKWLNGFTDTELILISIIGILLNYIGIKYLISII